MHLDQIIPPCHTGWPDPIPIHVIQVGQCTWPKSLLRAIQVGRIRYLSVSYRLANALGPNHCSVPYRLAGSDTYPCHTGRPIKLAQIIAPCHTGWPDMILSVSYRSANAVGPNHFFVPYRLAGSNPYPCHTGRPMHLAQIIAPCHTGWPDPIPIHVIQVGQCSWPKSLLRAIQVGRIRYLSVSYRLANALGPNHCSVPYWLAGYDPICVIQVGQCSWPKSFLRAIQVGQCTWPKSLLRAIQVGRI